MTISHRGETGHATYFITASTFQKQSLLQSERMASLFVDVLQHYRGAGKFLLHEFVVMPDHFHLVITPTTTLERAMQLVKGGFSFRVKKELGLAGEIWQTSFHDRRVRDSAEYQEFKGYIRQNPVKRGLAIAAEEFAFSSANKKFFLDPVPQRLKPLALSVQPQG